MRGRKGWGHISGVSGTGVVHDLYTLRSYLCTLLSALYYYSLLVNNSLRVVNNLDKQEVFKALSHYEFSSLYRLKKSLLSPLYSD